MFLIEYTTSLNPDKPVCQLFETQVEYDFWFSDYLPALQTVYGNDFVNLLKDIELEFTSEEHLDDLASFALAKKDLVIEHLIIRDEINTVMSSAEYDLIESLITEDDLDPPFEDDESQIAEVHEFPVI